MRLLFSSSGKGPSVGKDPESTYAADVFSDVLNDPGSNFQQRLVDSGLWQNLGVNYYTLNHTGPITISGQTSPENLRKAMAALDVEIAKFDDPGLLRPVELEAVKAHRAVTSAFDRERASGFAHTLGFWWSVASLEYYMGYVDNMAQQKTSDLRAYARKYIVGKPHVTGVLISPSDRSAIKLSSQELVRESRNDAACRRARALDADQQLRCVGRSGNSPPEHRQQCRCCEPLSARRGPPDNSRTPGSNRSCSKYPIRGTSKYPRASSVAKCQHSGARS